MAFNLTRAAAVLAGSGHARTRTVTVRAQLKHTSARIAHAADQQRLHLPSGWPGEAGLDELFRRACTTPTGSCLTTGPPGPTRDQQWKSRTKPAS